MIVNEDTAGSIIVNLVVDMALLTGAISVIVHMLAGDWKVRCQQSRASRRRK
jgi:hypothetical protein